MFCEWYGFHSHFALWYLEVQLKVPRLLDAVDFVSEDCDELSRMTYIAQFRRYYGENREEIDKRKKSGVSAQEHLRILKAKQQAEEAAKRAAEEAEAERIAAEDAEVITGLNAQTTLASDHAIQ
jgi:hypothetical protein